MSVEIRAAAEADVEDIAGLFLTCWRQNYPDVLTPSLVAAMTPERATAMWTAAMEAADPDCMLVAFDDPGELLGVTRFALTGQDTGLVQSLYVSPQAQGKGIGARLLHAASLGLRRLGARTANLWVFAENASSIAFYRRQGWAADDLVRVEEEFGAPELQLSRSLEDLPNAVEKP